ncbi:MAG: hypothetical protein ACI835_005960 [Planctomycetota bacterium]|jgi:hypothetical protein
MAKKPQLNPKRALAPEVDLRAAERVIRENSLSRVCRASRLAIVNTAAKSSASSSECWVHLSAEHGLKEPEPDIAFVEFVPGVSKLAGIHRRPLASFELSDGAPNMSASLVSFDYYDRQSADDSEAIFKCLRCESSDAS